MSSSAKGRYSSSAGNGKGRERTRSFVASSAGAKRPQMEATAEERDSDDDGIQGDSNGASGSSKKKTGILQILPAFSNSRYAQRHRKGGAYKDAPLPEGVKDPGVWIKDQGPLRVEAKVWLANQRTFIKWLHVAVLLGTLSVGLGNAAGVDNNIARTLSVVYTLVAIFAAAWGLSMYLWRSRLITQRSGKDFDNMLGPFIVSIALCVALILNFWFKYRAATQKTEGKGVWGLGFGMEDENRTYLAQEL